MATNGPPRLGDTEDGECDVAGEAAVPDVGWSVVRPLLEFLARDVGDATPRHPHPLTGVDLLEVPVLSERRRLVARTDPLAHAHLAGDRFLAEPLADRSRTGEGTATICFGAASPR